MLRSSRLLNLLDTETLYKVVAALFEDKVCAKAGRQDIIDQIGFVNFFPDTFCDVVTFPLIQVRVTVKIGFWLLESRFLLPFVAVDIPFLQIVVAGVYINGIIEIIRHEYFWLQLPAFQVHLQYINTFDNQDVRLLHPL